MGRLSMAAVGLALLLATPLPALAKSLTVEARDNVFDEAKVRIEAGDTVVWRNTGEAAHTATSEKAGFDSGNMAGGDTFEFTFDQPGEFAYICTYHESLGMVGTIVVAGKAPASAGQGEFTGSSEDLIKAAEPAGPSRRRNGPLAIAALGLVSGLALAARGVGRNPRV